VSSMIASSMNQVRAKRIRFFDAVEFPCNGYIEELLVVEKAEKPPRQQPSNLLRGLYDNASGRVHAL
jgi:hypothetical protein